MWIRCNINSTFAGNVYEERARVGQAAAGLRGARCRRGKADDAAIWLAGERDDAEARSSAEDFCRRAVAKTHGRRRQEGKAEMPRRIRGSEVNLKTSVHLVTVTLAQTLVLSNSFKTNETQKSSFKQVFPFS